ncbi:DMT family transporter [Microcella sp.]|uniref:DMT family transporter n=1 Tax=Microcella sp. TaxID=1913979 RepID=UPI003F730382
MNLITVVLVLAGTLISAGAQLLLKAGTTAVSQSPPSEGLGAAVLRFATEPFILAGVASYGLSMVIWIVVLSRLPVSVAYPMLSIGYIFTALFGYLLFGEQLGLVKVTGILLIILGVVVLSSAES